MTAGEAIKAFEAFPQASLAGFCGPGPAMILAPHPDDESLGCGGLIAEGCGRGAPPVVVILTDGAASHPGSRLYPPGRLRRVRADEARDAVAALGLPPDRLVFLDYPDTGLPAEAAGLDAAAEAVAALARRFGCSVIIGPWLHDPHCDHEAAALIAARAALIAGCRLLSYPVWGWLLPPDKSLAIADIRGWKLDISPHLDRKRRAMAAHASQYSAMIDDSPAGFRLPAALLAIFERPYEVFIAG